MARVALTTCITGSPHSRHTVATAPSGIWLLPRKEFHRVLGMSNALTTSTVEIVGSDAVTDDLEDRQGLTPERIAQWCTSALAGLTSGVIPDAVAVKRHRDEFARISDGIRRLPIFRGLPPSDLREVADRMFCVRCARGDTIFHHGEPADRFYIVQSGQVAVLPPADPLRRGVTVERGEAFGGKSFLTNARRAHTAIAIADTELWVLRKPDFDGLIRRFLALNERVRDYLEGEDAREYLREFRGLSAQGVERWIRQATRNVDSGRLAPSASDLAQHVNASHGRPSPSGSESCWTAFPNPWSSAARSPATVT